MFRPIVHRSIVYSSSTRFFSLSNALSDKHSCKILVVGGGSGGCSIAAKFAKNMKKDELIILEPALMHYYQPMFTLAGGGIKTVAQAGRPMSSVLPKNAKRLKDSVAQFDPKNNSVVTAKGDFITYDILIIAVGLKLHYDEIPGLLEAVENHCNVGSIYSPLYAEKTYYALQKFQCGNAVFTYPQSMVKCPGAPQKICYIAEDYFRKTGKRSKAKIMYNTSLPVIFGVKHYADALWKVVEKRDIDVNLQTTLIEVKPEKNEAVFKNVQNGKIHTMEYSLLHVAPPMRPPEVVTSCKELANEQGYVDVKKDTLQHVKYPNVFALGDCSSSPNSKTAAAVAAQGPVVYKNVTDFMAGKDLHSTYDGYASCPLVTGYGKCILAEFDYDLQPLETFPISQNRELWTMYIMKKDIMPALYWNMMLKGNWNGPGMMRKIMHLGLSQR